MECPECQFENPQDVKFCVHCGNKLETICSKCGSSNSPAFNFCGECGYDLSKSTEPASLEANEHDTQISESPPEETIPTHITAEGERKHVTALFSDMSGYTAMSEKLDPEEVKEITSRIFGEIFKIVNKYEGFVEKFIGDAVMALFGVPKAHEDDPVRAIRSAKEIHDLVEALSPELEERVGRPLSMHTGINTGLVVTGEVDMVKGTHGVAGATINLASRLSGLAKEGEILVAPDTYRQAEGYFTFEALEPTTVKGKTEPVQFYKVIFQKEIPVTTHGLSGVRADLVGRKVELSELKEAVEDLGTGKGGIFSICGDAGTGKSRLVEEFKAYLDLEKIQWLEGHAYAYAQNIPYFPMIDLLNRVFHIEEGDSTEKVRQKVESGVEDLVEKKESIVPYIGGLYSLSYPEIEEVSPEFWKSRLRDALQMILSALAQRAPTIYFLEDLHWADPSFVELLWHVLIDVRQPAIVLCVYRPVFNLFTTQHSRSMAKVYHEIRLQDLSSSEAQGMLESLLKTDSIPSDLRRFVKDKAEGNPFYLEEMVNSLIESETLIRDNGRWKVTKPLNESDISSTVHGVISSRIDRLENEAKGILQEASVIGRVFLYEILKQITELKEQIDKCLSGLQRLDLIKTRSIHTELEYIFKHALTQEVVYNGILKKERLEIHKRIGLVIEQLFQDRLPEFYETLAFHFKRSNSVSKAVHYLMKSGEKSYKRYALEESHEYYKEAFEVLNRKADKSKDVDKALIDLLIKWAYVFVYRGDCKEMYNLYSAYEKMAVSLDDKARLGMYYAFLGYALDYIGKGPEGYKILRKALKLGEEIRDEKVIGYACVILTWYCMESRKLDEAVTYGEKALEISKSIESGQDLYISSLGALGYTYWYRGESKKVFETGEALLDYGKRCSNIRSISAGHLILGIGYVLKGQFALAIECARNALKFSEDPLITQSAKFVLCFTYLLECQFDSAEQLLREIVAFSQNFSWEKTGTPAKLLLGAVLIAKGKMNRGIEMMQEAKNTCIKNQRQTYYAYSEYLFGKVYLQIVQKEGPKSLSTILKNIGFLIKHVPFASRKAEAHFNNAIELSKELGTKTYRVKQRVFRG